MINPAEEPLDWLALLIVILFALIQNIRRENRELTVTKRLPISVGKSNVILYLEHYPYKVEGNSIVIEEIEKIERNIYSWTFFTQSEVYRINILTGKYNVQDK